MIAYCDYIAHLISTYIKPHDTQGLLTDVSRPTWNLDVDGALSGTDKTITVTDVNGRRYKITVEEVDAPVEELVDGVSEALKALTIRGE